MGRTQRIGQEAEQVAEHYLQKQDLKCVARNYYCKMGEIDLIMSGPSNALVFIEVRYRKSDLHGSALESVTQSKCRKIMKTAQHYLQKNPKHQDTFCRFDVVSISSNFDKVDWIQDAFRPEGFLV